MVEGRAFLERAKCLFLLVVCEWCALLVGGRSVFSCDLGKEDGYLAGKKDAAGLKIVGRKSHR